MGFDCKKRQMRTSHASVWQSGQDQRPGFCSTSRRLRPASALDGNFLLTSFTYVVLQADSHIHRSSTTMTSVVVEWDGCGIYSLLSEQN